MTRNDIVALIDEHRHDFDHPGVLSMRPGYEITDDWFTGHEAIVVTVREKRDMPPGERLPERIAGVRIDVREASSRKLRQITDPQRYAKERRLTPDAGAVPFFAEERTPAGASPWAAAPAARATAGKPQLEYTPAPGVPLAPLELPARITVCASPDAGWPVLREFLGGTDSNLVVGMYDFTSRHVLDAVTQAATDKHLALTLDHPARNRTADLTDADTVAELTEQLGPSFSQGWALSRSDPEATAWIYPSAYHIKVAVRDGASTWLSSGNWNNSNQPDIDPVTGGPDSADATTARSRDRDWHVVVDQADLAAVFGAYLSHDLDLARQHNGAPEPVGPPLPAPALPNIQTPQFSRFFAPASFEGTARLTPLLTPDPGVYIAAVTSLVTSATSSLYLQFQYIELPRVVDADTQPFVDLVDAVIARQRAGVEVRIITSQYEVAGYLEQLIARGLDVKNVLKVQNNVHNKGIVVDGRAVLVSSQNWSSAGALRNRDAGLLIEDERVADYFTGLFLHDWEHLAGRAVVPD